MRCDACKFHEKGRRDPCQRDLCRRYPGPTFTTPGGWCGEFKDPLPTAKGEAVVAKKRKARRR